MDEEKIKQAQKEIESVINAGAPIVTLDIFKVLDEYVPSEEIKGKIEYTQELYTELIEKIKEYPKNEQEMFLQTLKDADIIDNQSIEKEDSFLLALYKRFSDITSIDILLKKLCEEKQISKEEFIKIHDVLLNGTTSQNKIGLRDNDLKFVGSFTPNPTTKFFFENRAISYFPIRHTEIDKALDKLLNYYNNKIKLNNQYDAYLIPIIIHGLIAALQLFKDGNTRYGRLLQSVLLFRLNKELYNIDLNLPIVYASRQYAAYRDNYRQKVEKIVLENNSEAWNEWISFNLSRLQDGLYYNSNSLDYLSAHKPKRI